VTALVADTHAIIWYYSGSPSLSATARLAMDGAIQSGDWIVIASITLTEVIYLIERFRLPATTFDVLEQALMDPAFGLVLAPLDLAVTQVLRRVPRGRIPGMPDRIITATAILFDVPLVTADQRIQASGIVPVLW
jgi:PIN domain nuclease of toxin-antitoxin system